ncbi:hypothetical protein KA013_05015 [Patescibacteria group bacterium]|nr:hypothetical protein [Patescibacteria group bacterium]
MHEDPETTNILDIMSGVIDTAHFSEFLRRHGYTEWQIEASVLREKDEALYHTLWEMHQKYGNPRIAFSGDFKNYENMLYNFFHPFGYQKRVHEYARPRFNFFTNKIAIYDLDFHKLVFDTPKVEKNQKSEIYGQENGEFPVPDLYTDAQRLLINYRISELAHAEQAQQQKRMRITDLIAWTIDYGRSGLVYGKTYHMPGTLEYEAHTIIEPKLIEEFISTYANYCETR